MTANRAGQKQIQQERSPSTSRRSLLAWATMATSILFSLPARAQQGDAAGDGTMRTFADLKNFGAEHQVRAMRYASSSYRIAMADGHIVEFAESDLRFAIDSSALGPRNGEPVILPAGQIGDRALVFFAAPEEIATFIKLAI